MDKRSHDSQCRVCAGHKHSGGNSSGTGPDPDTARPRVAVRGSDKSLLHASDVLVREYDTPPDISSGLLSDRRVPPSRVSPDGLAVHTEHRGIGRLPTRQMQDIVAGAPNPDLHCARNKQLTA